MPTTQVSVLKQVSPDKTMTIIQFITDDSSKSDKTLLSKVPRPRQPTPATQRDPSEGVQDGTLPIEASLQREQPHAPDAHRSQSSEGATTCS
jgi:hypothetical protein